MKIRVLARLSDFIITSHRSARGNLLPSRVSRSPGNIKSNRIAVAQPIASLSPQSRAMKSSRRKTHSDKPSLAMHPTAQPLAATKRLQTTACPERSRTGINANRHQIETADCADFRGFLFATKDAATHRESNSQQQIINCRGPQISLIQTVFHLRHWTFLVGYWIFNPPVLCVLLTQFSSCPPACRSIQSS